MFNKDNYSSKKFKPLKILFFVCIFIAFVTAISWLVMFLWNAILPDVVGVKPLTFWQAAGLLLLAKILFGGFGKGRGHWKNSKKKGWKNKWMNMNEEERQAAKTRWKEHCKNKSSKIKIE